MKLRSIHRTSHGRPSARAAPVARTSTKLKRGFACAAPTGIVIDNTETRSQLGNKEGQLLKSQLFEIELAKRNKARAEIETGKKKIEWGSQIRSYVMQPYKMIKDVRTNHETSNVDAVMNGDTRASSRPT